VHAHHALNLTHPLANALHAPVHTLQTALVQPALMFTLPFASALPALVLIPKIVVVLSAMECK
jgi:hypothetical protein